VVSEARPYADPGHPGNGPEHHTGEACVEEGCDRPAGTAWSPYWCQPHNAERIDRISRQLDGFIDRFEKRRKAEEAGGEPNTGTDRA